MNNKELQAARRLLFLEVSEAATQIGGASTRTWQRWEKGDYTIPSDVVENIKVLASQRLNMIKAIDELIAENNGEKIEITYYSSLDEYQLDHPGSILTDWRISQSVAAYYLMESSAVLA